jgi:hypothetical protein
MRKHTCCGYSSLVVVEAEQHAGYDCCGRHNRVQMHSKRESMRSTFGLKHVVVYCLACEDFISLSRLVVCHYMYGQQCPEKKQHQSLLLCQMYGTGITAHGSPAVTLQDLVSTVGSYLR